MNKLISLILCFAIGQISYALDVVYPKKTHVTINSPTTFFIGSSNNDVTINGKKIDIHPSGGFAYFVELKEGENIFQIKSNDEVLKYNILRPKNIATKYKAPDFNPFKENKYLEVTNDNSPLRSTPVDSGINRIAHLPSGTLLISDGEKLGFYRIKLGTNTYGWISKSNIKTITEKIEPAQITDYKQFEDNKYFTYIFKLDRKVPFEITEGEKLSLKLFNMKECENSTYFFEFSFKQKGIKKLVGYKGYYDGNDFILKIRKTPHIYKFCPLVGITIAVDAGHGGKELGAIGCLGDKEKDITLDIAKHLKTELKHLGANVILTRSDDTYHTLYSRVDTANENDAVILVSIHANALPDTKNPLEHQGTSIYYYYNQAKPLAESILSEMTKQLNTKNDNVRQESFALVRNTDALSILIETAYMINPEDNAMLINPDFRKKCAKAISDGIINYFKE